MNRISCPSPWPPAVYRPSSKQSTCRWNGQRDERQHVQCYLVGDAPVGRGPHRCVEERRGSDKRQDCHYDPRDNGGDRASHIVIVGRRRLFCYALFSVRRRVACSNTSTLTRASSPPPRGRDRTRGRLRPPSGYRRTACRTRPACPPSRRADFDSLTCLPCRFNVHTPVIWSGRRLPLRPSLRRALRRPLVRLLPSGPTHGDLLHATILRGRHDLRHLLGVILLEADTCLSLGLDLQCFA